MPWLPPPANHPPEPVLPSQRAWPLHGVEASRQIEAAGLAATPAHALIERAGLAVARLAQAVLAPGEAVAVLAGPGNNGGDGLIAAAHLQRWGQRVQVYAVGPSDKRPDDARHAWALAQGAGVPICTGLPATPPPVGLWLDALLGLGARRAPSDEMAAAIRLVNADAAAVLAVDLPSGLCADTGRVLGEAAVRADHTLSLLTLKPGLFTGAGREHSGRVWWHGLALPAEIGAPPPDAWLTGPPRWPERRHGQHKGSFGDVLVVGGAPGMGGAALLAARAALRAGAGRVLLCMVDEGGLWTDPVRPELMPRQPATALTPQLLTNSTVVCGCGGGDDVARWLPGVLHYAARLVLDADGLNAVALDSALLAQLAERSARGQPTIVTPHPLEAARLLGCTAADIQADRLGRALALAVRCAATVVLKGSGSVVAAAGETAVINPTGNPRLATAGSGDVLAGWLGGAWSAQPATPAHALASAVTWRHGHGAETAAGDHELPLRADDLIEAMAGSNSGVRSCLLLTKGKTLCLPEK